MRQSTGLSQETGDRVPVYGWLCTSTERDCGEEEQVSGRSSSYDDG